MIPRSKLARNLATTARRSALPGSQYATATAENLSTISPGSKTTASYCQTSSALKGVQSVVQRDGRVDITAAISEVERRVGGLNRPHQFRTAIPSFSAPRHERPNSSAYTPFVDTLTPRSHYGHARQCRAFHSSAERAASGDASKAPSPDSYEARKHIPTSSWARPHKPSQDADDNVVPSYYVERKRQREEIAERKEEEGSLMAELNAGILSEGLAAETKPRDEKIPVEVRDPREGIVLHPSGFQPPTPETQFHPAVAKKSTEDHPLLETIKQRWDDLPTDQKRVTSRPDLDANVEKEFARRRYLHDQAEMDAAEVLGNPDVVVHPQGTAAEPAGTVSPLGAHTTAAQRAQIPTSSWDTPERRKVLTRRQREENTRDDVVPAYYIERKRQRESIAERKEEEGGLMSELNAGILSEGLAAEVRVREEKIPVEVFIPEEGRVRHPSGFEPPTPETEFHPAAAKSPTEEHPVIATKKVPWHEQDVLNTTATNGNSNGNGSVASSSNGSRALHTCAFRAHRASR